MPPPPKETIRKKQIQQSFKIQNPQNNNKMPGHLRTLGFTRLFTQDSLKYRKQKQRQTNGFHQNFVYLCNKEKNYQNEETTY